MEDGRGTPLAYRLLDRWMRLLALLVPKRAREAWRAEWDGELWYGVLGRPGAPRWGKAVGLARGLLRDALNVRREAKGHGYGREEDGGMMGAIVTDVGFSVRMLRKAPGFTAVAVTTLALGIGATVTVFSVVDALLLSPLPYPDADRLVMLWQGRRSNDLEEVWFSGGQYQDLRSQAGAFDELAVVEGGSATLTGRGRATRLGLIRASSNYLGLLGATAALGRPLDEQDDRAEASPVALLTYRLWRDSFGDDPNVVGQTITLDGGNFEVVGVLSPDLVLNTDVLPVVNGTGQIDVVLSLPLSAEMLSDRDAEDYNLVGKLAPGASLDQAQEQLDRVAGHIRALYESDPQSGFFIRAVPLLEQVVGSVRRPLILLLASVGGVLLIACVNVANLLLARGGGRRREMGVRAAIGASRRRLVRQLITESAVLATVGAGLGVGVAVACLEVVRRLGATSLPRVPEIAIDYRILLFALGATAFTCVVFGLVPAWRTSRVDPGDTFGSGGGRSTGGGALWSRFNLPSALVSAEVGLTLALLVASGLMIRSFVALGRVDPGFDPYGRVAFRVYPSREHYGDLTARIAYYDRLVRHLEGLPGVDAVAASSHVPFDGGVAWAPVEIVDYAPPRGEQHGITSDFRYITPGYFATMGIPLLQGRDFQARDRMGEPRVAIVDQRFADRYFPDRDPIGMQLESWGPVTSTIVGVVGTVKNDGLDQGSRVTTYLPARQEVYGAMYMVLATTGDPTTLAASAARAVAALDPSVPVLDLSTMVSRIQASLDERRFATVLLEILSGVALVLAVVGVYGLVSYRVGQSARELGLRIALGASTGTILRLVLRHGAGLASVGVAVGLPAAFSMTGLLRSMLFGVEAFDGATYGAVAAGLAVTCMIASYVPARRAAAVDPLEVIRSE